MILSDLKVYKKSGEKISCLTAYDASFAKIFDDCGVDIILVGDSLGGVIQGGENTLKVTMNEMIYHTRAVASGAQNALVIADMPYRSYLDAQQTLDNARRLIDAGAQMVKFEGAREFEACFEILKNNNIPVCAHLGLQPQSVLEMGGYKVQGRDASSAQRIIEDAKLVQSWGARALLLECIPSALGKQISATLTIPTIGIGAGVDCDGQVLVSYDMLGISGGRMPKFVQNFLQQSGDIKTAVKHYIHAVKDKKFPTDAQSY
jgi:3-methyl-2-oxobutanoate hydroxymethyltransferase